MPEGQDTLGIQFMPPNSQQQEKATEEEVGRDAQA